MHAECLHSSRAGEPTSHQETAVISLVATWEGFLGLLLGQDREVPIWFPRPPAPRQCPTPAAAPSHPCLPLIRMEMRFVNLR